MSRGRRSAHSGATEDDRVAEARARGTFQREVSGLLLAIATRRRRFSLSELSRCPLVLYQDGPVPMGLSGRPTWWSHWEPLLGPDGVR